MDFDQSKGLHPFFSKSSKNPPPSLDGTTETNDTPDIEPQETAETVATKKRGRKPGSKNTHKKDGSSVDGKQSSLESFARRLNGEDANTEPTVSGDTVTQAKALESDTNKNRRKRRKTASPQPSGTHVIVENTLPVPMDWQKQLISEAEKAEIQQQTSATEDQRPTDINETSKSDIPTQKSVQDANLESMPNTNPKKLLKVNKNGKLLSSPPPNIETDSTAPKKRRTRKTSKPKPSSMIVVIKYGIDAESRKAFGEKITAALEGEKIVEHTSNPPKSAIKPSAKPPVPPKSTHPFFLGKAAQKKDDYAPANDTTAKTLPPSPKGSRKSAVTPGKLKVESHNENKSTSMAGFGFGNVRASKQAGTDEAPWPSKENAHVRNLEGENAGFTASSTRCSSLKDRKLKKKFFSVSEEDNLMRKLSRQLEPSMRFHSVPPSEFAPPRDVRLPTRLLTTGATIQDRVRQQVSAPLRTSRDQGPGRTLAHPAIQSLFLDIEHTLTPFDLATCENQSWVQKYAPKKTSHVLQAGQEALIFQDWLRSLTVLTVGGAQSEPKIADVKKPPKKKRKKAVDDFIVDSDEEEEEELVEVDNGQANASSSSSPRSVRRARWTRNQNVVVVSGPPGCGKSAMVFAVAKELGFEVFEINSGSRRSGKDIFDKVGDMSENHLVNHKQKNVAQKPEVALAEDTDTDRNSEALQKDIESGRQSTMASFFKSKSAAKPSSKPKAQKPKAGDAPKSTQATLSTGNARQKSQKQSLILFEEADVLYDEDQQFWTSVSKLASLSKRPIVITCNTESLIPWDQLPLAAILRLSPPPTELATDYMLVLAGHEGHVIEREAISSLYRYKNHDLRASITELNLWCQMSVGDKKGGLEWMYQRWPPGKDVDENGHILRVASENTYAPGMGCLSHNIYESVDNIVFNKQDELLKESWEDWGIEPSRWTIGNKRVEHAQSSTQTTSVDLLKQLDALTESISAIDIYCRVDLPSYGQDHDQPSDPTLPPVSVKERLNYTTASRLVQVDHVSDYNKLDTNLSVQSHILVQRVYGGRPGADLEESCTVPDSETEFSRVILSQKQSLQNKDSLSRPDFSEAFDILAEQPDAVPAANTSYNLHASSFDRTFSIVVEDIAPYIRSIVAYESLLDAQRIRLGNLLSEGGQGGTKRARTTRAARTALEGGDRKTKRRERWFDKRLSHQLVMRTGGKTWAGMGSNMTVMGPETGSQKTEDSPPASQE
ncbi:P-loop containing nucleoside triphosphate hydrolase protein [Periconia macrospinosa]|uniref:P-loop containing nucleoside triphosphate hydrolase protein n=1 Tax=Periconia macrospinosa TaxID=97972 RepID=A0A2V1DW45_9PLEO|nr:P-loop containing nucleoside triphosphate hydrolase protein [Periconia macrospinosa]